MREGRRFGNVRSDCCELEWISITHVSNSDVPSLRSVVGEEVIKLDRAIR